MNKLQEFLKDVRENPDSFQDLCYQTLLKTVKDIQNNSYIGELGSDCVTDKQYSPKYLNKVMPLLKPGFKDTCGPQLIPAVVIDLKIRGKAEVERVQLVIHASANRSQQLGIRVKYPQFPDYIFYPCKTSEVLTTVLFALR